MIAATASWVSFPFIQIGSYSAKAFIVAMSASSYAMGDFVDNRSSNGCLVTDICQLLREFDCACAVSPVSVPSQRIRGELPYTHITRQLVFLNQLKRNRESNT
jgi:hypothetical protein